MAGGGIGLYDLWHSMNRNYISLCLKRLLAIDSELLALLFQKAIQEYMPTPKYLQ